MPVFGKFIILLLATIVITIGIFATKQLLFFPGQLTKAYIGNRQIYVKIARTPPERQQGLSGIKIMNNNQGMLFVFDKKEKYSFWMKDMNFNLDFIWITQGSVVDLTEDVPSPAANNGEISQISPRVPIDMVLEARSGFIKQNKINLGNKFYFEI